jgi:Protein kinase domain
MCSGCRPRIVTAESEPVASGGWRIATGFAASTAARHSRNFYAVYAGDAFGHAERGLIATLARAHPEVPGHSFGARDSAQLAVHSLAEGYFGAQRTLSSRRAASLALTAVNRWLFGQARAGAGAAHAFSPVSLTALCFHQTKIGVVQIGICQLYRYRNNVLSPLAREHSRLLPDGSKFPTRAIGLDLELSIDYEEETAEPADRYILLAGVAAQNPDVLYNALSGQLDTPAGDPASCAQRLRAALGGDDATVMVLDILERPPAAGSAWGDSLADLPLRPAPREGDVWDGFVLGKTLYRGRYTLLKAAYDSIEKRQVALKIPLPSMLQDEVFSAGFMREAWIGTTVRGAAIARYLELPPERRSSLYLVMPLYEGETLEVRLRRGPAMNLPDGIGIALKLCEAVQDLAAIQIVHRDIKPENIMLLQGNEIRLLDLGLAYLPGIDFADAFKPGGTVRYMAPELLQGVAANARTEVFALAVTIYRMFSGGAYPFGQRESVPLARLRPDLPRWLGLCLARALAPKPTERYADAGEFARALQLGLTTSAEDDTRPTKILPFTEMQIWRALTFLFGAGFLFLLLRGIK